MTRVPKLERRLARRSTRRGRRAGAGKWPKRASSWSWTDVRMAAAGRASHAAARHACTAPVRPSATTLSSPVLIPGRSVPQSTEAQLGFVKRVTTPCISLHPYSIPQLIHAALSFRVRLLQAAGIRCDRGKS